MVNSKESIAAEAPKGSPFIIEQSAFTPGQRIHVEFDAIPEDRIQNWPMVYILANRDSAYVGQTTSITSRMNQHGANEEKRDFYTVNVIYNDEFNSSVITDYEHRLIGYLHADGRYRLTNKNNGMLDTNYFGKAVYSRMFEDLWQKLRELNLATHSIQEIEESEAFKYSPFKSLNRDQRTAFEQIRGSINTKLINSNENGADCEPILVEGMPGTGKTVVAIYLLKSLLDDPRFKNLNIRILEPVTALRNTLRKALANVEGLDSVHIIGPMDLIKEELGYVQGKDRNFDIVLVDEAHKLKQRVNLGTQFANYDNVNRTMGLPKDATQLDWVIKQAKLPVFFYDSFQSIGPSCVTRDSFYKKLGASAKHPIRLETQMRVRGGNRYLNYLKAVLSGTQNGRVSFHGYDVVVHSDFASFVSSFEHKHEKYDLTRMVAGYAWKWLSKKDTTAYDIVIDDIGLRWNRTYDNWVGRGVDDASIAQEVGCIHSIQGYDLSYAYVIIGKDMVLDENGAPIANKSNYYDRNGKATASPKELDQYIKNIYYVLLSRGIYGTHIYVADDTLREYFTRYFPSE